MSDELESPPPPAGKRVLSTPSKSPAPKRRSTESPTRVAERKHDDDFGDFFTKRKVFNFQSKVIPAVSQSQPTFLSQAAPIDIDSEDEIPAATAVDLDEESLVSSTSDEQSDRAPEKNPATKKRRARKEDERKKRKVKGKQAKLPRLPNKQDLVLILPSSDLAIEDGSDLEVVQPKKKGKRNAKAPAPKIDPPDVIDIQELEAARAKLQEKIGYKMLVIDKLPEEEEAESATANPKLAKLRKPQKAKKSAAAATVELEDDLEDLDPAFAAALAARKAPTSGVATSAASSSNNPLTQADLGNSITFTVKMVAMPTEADFLKLEEAQRNRLKQWEEAVQVVVRSREQFEVAFRAVAKLKSMPQQDVVLEFEGKKLFSSSTPESLRIFFDSNLTGYREDTYKEIIASRLARMRSPSVAHSPPHSDAEEIIDGSAIMPAEHVQADEDEEEEMPPNSIGLKLRSRNFGDLEVFVRRDLRIKAIIKTFCKAKRCLDMLKTARLEFEGEPLPLQSRVGESEVEDEDALDIVFA